MGLDRPATFASLAAFALVVGAGLSGCGDQGGPYFGTTERRAALDARTFYVNNGNEPEYLDPGLSHDSASSMLIDQLFEGLTSYARGDLHPVAAGAIAWDQSDDNRYFRFHLRPDAKWSDGKPVTARDYEYAWRRVLSPATAAQSAPNLYVLKNGEAFNRGRLRSVAARTPLLGEPREGAPPLAELPAGAAVEVLARSPMRLDVAVAPLAAVPAGGALDRAKEGLVLEGGAKVGLDDAWKDAEVEVREVGPDVSCDGAPDHWLRVSRGGASGWLPGCALGATKRPARFAFVRRFRALPTFAPPPAPPPGGVDGAEGCAVPAGGRQAARDADLQGFVLADSLVDDPSVLGVRALDDLTLEVELERPTPYFLDLTGVTTLYPVREDVLEPLRERGTPELWTRPEHIVSNGPFVLEEHKFRYELRLAKNPHYYDAARMKLDRVVVLEVEEYHAAMNLYKAGDLDYLGDNSSPPSEYLPLLGTKKDFLRFPYLSTYWYEINTRKPPFDDVRVRRALNLAIDKQLLVDRVTKGGQAPATHYVPDYTGLGYAEAVAADRARGADPFQQPDVAYNPELARKLLGEAGFPVVKDGDGYRAEGFPGVEILYNTSEGHRAIAVAVQAMWRDVLGVRVTLRNEEWKVLLKNVRDGNFQVVRFGWQAEYNHANTWMDTFLSFSPNNRTGWSSAELDGLVRRAAMTADPRESIRIYRQAEKVAVDGMPKIPLYFYTRQTLVKPWVMGFAPNARNVQLMKWLWVDPSRQEMPGDTGSAYAPLELPPPGRLAPRAEAAP